jgi:hypothetical protein
LRAFGRFAAAAAVPTTAAVAALAAVWFWLSAETAPAKAAVQIVFIGLSCLSAPHMLLSAWSARARTPVQRSAARGVVVAASKSPENHDDCGAVDPSTDVSFRRNQGIFGVVHSFMESLGKARLG